MLRTPANLARSSSDPLFRGWELGEGGHLFEKLFGKDPYGQVRALERRGLGTSRYKLVEVK